MWDDGKPIISGRINPCVIQERMHFYLVDGNLSNYVWCIITHARATHSVASRVARTRRIVNYTRIIINQKRIILRVCVLGEVLVFELVWRLYRFARLRASIYKYMRAPEATPCVPCIIGKLHRRRWQSNAYMTCAPMTINLSAADFTTSAPGTVFWCVRINFLNISYNYTFRHRVLWQPVRCIWQPLCNSLAQMTLQ